VWTGKKTTYPFIEINLKCPKNMCFLVVNIKESLKKTNNFYLIIQLMLILLTMGLFYKDSYITFLKEQNNINNVNIINAHLKNIKESMKTYNKFLIIENLFQTV